eukprot:m.58736 g.58736  ORF g.58736 m.58736 type:complete len:773 (-) comp7879_c0_seq1:28-2346(-)
MYRQLKLGHSKKRHSPKMDESKKKGDEVNLDAPTTLATEASTTTTSATTTATAEVVDGSSLPSSSSSAQTTESETSMTMTVTTLEKVARSTLKEPGFIRHPNLTKSTTLGKIEEDHTSPLSRRGNQGKRSERSASFRIKKKSLSTSRVRSTKVTWHGIVNEIRRLEKERRESSSPSKKLPVNYSKEESTAGDNTSEQNEQQVDENSNSDDDDSLDDDDINSLLEKLANVVNITEESTSHNFSEIMNTIQQKQFDLDRATLEWSRPPKNILVIKKLYDEEVTDWFITVTTFLVENFDNVKVFFPPQMVMEDDKEVLHEHKRLRNHLRHLHTWRVYDKGGQRHDMPNFDLIITLGGDGTLLHVSHTFQKNVPPVVSFALGSLGFLTHFNIENYKSIINTVLEGGLLVTLRSRLHCRLIDNDLAISSNCEKRKRMMQRSLVDDDTMSIASTVDGEDVLGTEEDSNDNTIVADEQGSDGDSIRGNGDDDNDNDTSKGDNNGEGDDDDDGDNDDDENGNDEEEVGHIHTSMSFINQESVFDFNDGCDMDFKYEILNEIVVDRGPSPYLTKLLVFVGDVMVTTVQGDGLIVATPTGSTAYSLAAGGSMCHPSVPCVLITPICPHSLSFRPIIVPASVPVRIKVPMSARNPAYVSFDGRNRQKLDVGMSIIVSPSRYPIPTISRNRVSTDWFQSLSHCLGWNIRESQKAFHYKKKGGRKRTPPSSDVASQSGDVITENTRKLLHAGLRKKGGNAVTFQLGENRRKDGIDDDNDSVTSEV